MNMVIKCVWPILLPTREIHLENDIESLCGFCDTLTFGALCFCSWNVFARCGRGPLCRVGYTVEYTLRGGVYHVIFMLSWSYSGQLISLWFFVYFQLKKPLDSVFWNVTVHTINMRWNRKKWSTCMEKVCVTKMDWTTILKSISDGDAVWKHKIKSSSTEPVTSALPKFWIKFRADVSFPALFPPHKSQVSFTDSKYLQSICLC